MRKRIFALLGILMSVSIVACSGNSNTMNQDNDSVEAESGENSSAQDTESSDSADNIEETETVSDEAEPEETEDVVYNIGEVAPLMDWEITVSELQIVDSVSADYITFKPNEEGDKLAKVSVSVENKGKEGDTFLPSIGLREDVSVKLVYGDGYEFSATQLLGYDKDMFNAQINPLSSQSGDIVFEIPESVASATEELLMQFSAGDDVISIKIR